MKTIGLFYAMNAAKTSHIAEKIREDLGGVKVIEVVLIEKAWQNDRTSNPKAQPARPP